MVVGKRASAEGKKACSERMKQVWAKEGQTYQDGCEVYFTLSDWART